MLLRVCTDYGHVTGFIPIPSTTVWAISTILYSSHESFLLIEILGFMWTRTDKDTIRIQPCLMLEGVLILDWGRELGAGGRLIGNHPSILTTDLSLS